MLTRLVFLVCFLVSYPLMLSSLSRPNSRTTLYVIKVDHPSRFSYRLCLTLMDVLPLRLYSEGPPSERLLTLTSGKNLSLKLTQTTYRDRQIFVYFYVFNPNLHRLSNNFLRIHPSHGLFCFSISFYTSDGWRYRKLVVLS